MNVEFPVPEHPRARPTWIGEELEGLDEIIYVDTESGASISVNTIGAAILDLCDGEHNADQIATIIADTLQAEPFQVLQDTQNILEEFAAYGLFEE